MTASATNTVRRLLFAGAISITAALSMAACENTASDDPAVESEEMGDEEDSMDEDMDEDMEEGMDEDMEEMDEDMEEMDDDS
ncbi:hypothetical protein [Nocardiopsis valliformis]|uniref:hypothetical protein n=1 Tax=Nocardiopsis valliformis TaxID=239974 RepID=UPI00034DA1C6|nr:hypothetical protein [Nocardiopsis valliformis]